MPTEQEIQFFLSRLQRLSESEQTDHDSLCPICFENYSPPDEAIFQQADALGLECDYPVLVRSLQPNSACRHVFGRACIEQHFRSSGPWCTKCPTCREEWFPDAGPREGVDFITIPGAPRFLLNRETGYGQYFAPPQSASTVFSMTIDGLDNQDAQQRVSLEAAGPLLPRAAQQSAQGQGRHQQHSGQQPADLETPQVSPPPLRREDATLPGTSNRYTIHNATVYLHRMLLTDAIDEADDETTQKVVDVKDAIEALWARLEHLPARTVGHGTANWPQNSSHSAQGPAEEPDRENQGASANLWSDTAAVMTTGRPRILYA